MHSNAIMAFLRKCVGQQWYPFIYMDLSLILCTHLSIGNPLITDAEKHFMTALLLATFKNKYVNANGNFVVNQNYSEYIIENNL